MLGVVKSESTQRWTKTIFQILWWDFLTTFSPSMISHSCLSEDRSELVYHPLLLLQPISVFSSRCSSAPVLDDELLNMNYPILDSLGSQIYRAYICICITAQFECVRTYFLCGLMCR